MRARDYPLGASFLGIAILVGSLDMLLEAISLVVRYEHAGVNPALGWRCDPGVILPILLVALLYGLGLRQPAASGEAPLRIWRHVGFFAALLILFLVLQSPFDAISDRLFMAHQLQHMALCMVIPILVALSLPQATLLRGVPFAGRRYVLGPFFRSRVFGALRFLAHPAAASVLYIAANYFWMIPHIQDLALHNERIHDLMHATLLAAGLIFFWRVLDPRPYPLGPAIATRLFMFWLAAIADILLGSFLAFKSVVLYHAYGPSPHLFGIAALDDERYGGLTMWIPGAGMVAFAAMITIRRFAIEEEHRDLRRPATPLPAAQIRARQQAANRRMALTLGLFAGVVLLITLATVLVYRYAGSSALLALL